MLAGRNTCVAGQPDQCHSSRVFTHLTGWFRNLRPNTKGPSPLMAASHTGSVEIVRLLFKHQSSLVPSIEVNGFDDTSQSPAPWDHPTALHYALDGWFALATGSFALFQLPWGEPPVDVAANHGRYEEIIKLLLDAGAAAVGEEGADPLSFATELKLPRAVELLVRYPLSTWTSVAPTLAECSALFHHTDGDDIYRNVTPFIHRCNTQCMHCVSSATLTSPRC
jgi:hypothetical protein